MEMNMEKNKVIISRQPSQAEIMINQKHLEIVDYFSCFGGMITNDARYTREIKCRIAVAKAVLNKKT